MHLGGRHKFSTFRRSLGSILANSRGNASIHEIGLTAWMHAHLRIMAVAVNDADSLGDLETEVLLAIDPPLNLSNLVKTPLRSRLSELRRSYGLRPHVWFTLRRASFRADLMTALADGEADGQTSVQASD